MVIIPLDVNKIIAVFYKKQDYEPFAIPFGFPVLDDVNWKMELKKVDQAITRTIENVILLVTMGNTPDKGGINPNNLRAMQTLFQNESPTSISPRDRAPPKARSRSQLDAIKRPLGAPLILPSGGNAISILKISISTINCGTLI